MIKNYFGYIFKMIKFFSFLLLHIFSKWLFYFPHTSIPNKIKFKNGNSPKILGLFHYTIVDTWKRSNWMESKRHQIQSKPSKFESLKKPHRQSWNKDGTLWRQTLREVGWLMFLSLKHDVGDTMSRSLYEGRSFKSRWWQEWWKQS